MLTDNYEDVLNRAQRLAPADQLRLLEELAAIVRRRVMARLSTVLLNSKG